MRDELEQQLHDEYPDLYAALDATEGDDLYKTPLAQYGIQCGDGWYGLLDALSAFVTGQADDETIVLHQVKQKFGGLRFYHGGIPDALPERQRQMIFGAITFAEQFADQLCELCGQPAVENSAPMSRARCADCLDSRPPLDQ